MEDLSNSRIAIVIRYVAVVAVFGTGFPAVGRLRWIEKDV